VYQTSVADTQGEFVLHEAVDGEWWTVDSGGTGGKIPSNLAQTTTMPVSGPGGNVLPLALLEQVFGDLAPMAAYSLQPNANFPLPNAYSLQPNANFPLPTANCLLLDGGASEAEESDYSGLGAFFAHEVFVGDQAAYPGGTVHSGCPVSRSAHGPET